MLPAVHLRIMLYPEKAANGVTQWPGLLNISEPAALRKGDDRRCCDSPPRYISYTIMQKKKQKLCRNKGYVSKAKTD